MPNPLVPSWPDIVCGAAFVALIVVVAVVILRLTGTWLPRRRSRKEPSHISKP